MFHYNTDIIEIKKNENKNKKIYIFKELVIISI